VSIFKKAVNFLTEVKAELGKVSWSTRQELISSTIVVIVITAIMSLFIGMIDICLSKLLSILFK
jgi:preprotein translocase subunit SecE